MHPISIVLGLWRKGIWTDADVIKWADSIIESQNDPEYGYIALSTKGPEALLKISDDSIPRPIDLSYIETFAFRAIYVDAENEQSLYGFMKWLVSCCAGEDLSNYYVELAYQLDHLIDDCDDVESAMRMLKEEWGQILELSDEITKPIIIELPNNSFHNAKPRSARLG